MLKIKLLNQGSNIKHIVIAKCNLFSIIVMPKKPQSIEWCLVDCFHPEFRVFTQIMVCDYCIAKCKMFSACGGLLMALWAILLQFKIFMLNWTQLSLNIFINMRQCCGHWNNSEKQFFVTKWSIFFEKELKISGNIYFS